MVNSIDGENSEVHGDQQEELVAPVFAEDLAPNVRAGFDNTCDYIRRSHAALSAQITRLAVRIDALGDAPARAAVQPPPAAPHHDVIPCRPAANYDHRQGNDVGELEDDADYAPQQRPFDAHPAGARRVHPHARDRVGHVVRVPVDDGGLRRIKLSIPPFSSDCGPEY